MTGDDLEKIENDLRARLESLEIKASDTNRDIVWIWVSVIAAVVGFAVAAYIYLGARA